MGARPDASFVTEKSAMTVRTSAGIERVMLDGSGRTTVFARPSGKSSVGTPHQWHVQAISPDFSVWALGNSDTEIFVGDYATGTTRQVTAVGNRASAAAFSPDNKRLALGRHSDFSVSGSKDDDTLYIVDVATLATVTLAPATDHWPSTITWSDDGKALWVTMNHGQPSQWVTLPDPAKGTKESRDLGLSAPKGKLAPRSPLSQQVACGGKTVVAERWEPEVRVVDTADAGTVVARLDGRKRGFHDYLPDFSEVTWSPGCGYVIFSYDNRLWAVPAGGGNPGPIIEGDRIVFVP